MPSRAATPARRRRWLTAPLGALALVVAFPATAFAAPPPGLPGHADSLERTYQPSYDYDTDGCYPTPAIGADGTVNGGLKPAGALNGNCRDAADLDNTNGYARAKCDGEWCAYMYGLYFEKDQALPGTGLGGHRHDWEHVVVWVRDGTVEYVSTSSHGSFDVHARSEIRFDGTHPKIVYHKDGISTHCFRLATSGDEPPENHAGTWRYPALVGWNGYPAGVREKLASYDFGSANFGLKDGSFASHLAAAKPAGVPFDPNA
ncbi:NPP1 family protein [Streptomyces sp. NPDC057376]|uniref:NPP1 family protein n=1 Tax=Streptomyces sp. NPDC057376 TaxID=3346110 RepID=UPI003630A621